MKKCPMLRLLLALASGVFIGLPAQAGPSSAAPPHTRAARQDSAAQHRFVYYPAQQIYYSQTSQTWYWLNDGKWNVGVHLPRQRKVLAGSVGLPVMLQSQRPYEHHAYVEQQYGRPWREKHGHTQPEHAMQAGLQDHTGPIAESGQLKYQN